MFPSFAAANIDPNLPAGYDQAVKILRYFRLVSGDENGLRPLDTLTRAEVAKLAVVGMAMGDQQSYYQNNTSFPDVQGHWAQGYAALARQLGIMLGYPDGTFHPDAPVSYAEAVALMVRVAGLSPSGNDWPDNWARTAKESGVLPPDAPYLDDLSASARRADVFLLLYRALTEVKDYSGMSLLQRRFKPIPPTISMETLPLTTRDLHIVVNGTVDSAESASVNGVPAALTDGRFTATVSLSIGLNKVEVQAKDIAGNINVVQQQIVRENTDAAKIIITGPHNVGAGKTVHLDVSAQDTNGASILNFANMLAAVPPQLGSFDVYSGTFYAAQAPAQGNIVLSLGGATATWPLTVGSGTLVSLRITPENALVKRGQELSFSLAGTDEFGNTVDVSGLSPVWKAEGGVINQKGLFAPTAGGIATVTATAETQTVSTKVTIYGTPAKLSLKTPDHLTANRKDTVQLAIEVQDADGNLVPDYTGTVHVETTAAGVANISASTVAVVAGKATVSLLAGSQPGNATVLASSNQLAAGSVVVTVDPQRLSGIILASDPLVISADGTTKQMLSVVAVDSHGAAMLTPLNPPLTVHLVSSQSTAVLFDSTSSGTTDIGLGAIDGVTGTVTTQVVLRSGTTEAAATLSGLVIGPQGMSGVPVRTLPMRAVRVGGVAKLSFDHVQPTTAGGTIPLYVRVLDANGNQVSRTSDLQPLVLTLRDQNGKTYPATVDLVTGAGRAEFDVLLYQATTHTFTVSGSGGSQVLQPASQSVVVSPAAPASVVVSAEPSLIRLDNGISHTTLVAAIQDAYGNQIPAGNYQINFQRLQSTGATGPMPSVTSVTTQQGVARLVVPSGSTVGTDMFTASTNGLTTRNSVSVRGVIMGVPTKLSLRYGDNNGDGIAGGPTDNTGAVGAAVTVYVDILDNQNPGYVTTTENGRFVTLTLKNLTTGDQQSYTSNVQYGTATFTFAKSTATTYSIQATSAALTSTGTIGMGGSALDLVLRSGAGAALVVTADQTSIKANPGKSFATVTVSLVDGLGNPTINTSPNPITVTLKASNTTYGNFTQSGAPNGTSTDTATVVIQPNAAVSSPVNWYSTAQFGPATIAASAPNYATNTVVITSRLVGSAAGLRVATLVDTVAQPYTSDHNSVQGQDVRLTVVDAQGYQVTDYGTAGEQLTLSVSAGVVIVAYYDYNTGTWNSLDQTPTGTTSSYLTTYALPAYKGQAWFRVRSNLAGSYSYTAVIPAVAPQTPITQVATGKFTAGPLARLNLVANPTVALNGSMVNPVSGGGNTIAVMAQFTDLYGNVITNQAGTVFFQVMQSGFGMLLSNNALAQNGVASAVFQSAGTLPLPNGAFQITAYTSITQPNGLPLLSGSQSNPASITITEDSSPPAVQTVTVSPGSGTADVVTAGDSITINLSEALKGTTVFSGLTYGSTLTTSLSNLRVFFSHNGGAPDTITFGGGLQVGTVTMQADNMDLGVGNNVTAYDITSLSLNATGTQVIVTLGNPLGGAQPVSLTLSADPTKTTFTANPTLTDIAGNVVDQTPIQLNLGSQF